MESVRTCIYKTEISDYVKYVILSLSLSLSLSLTHTHTHTAVETVTQMLPVTETYKELSP
jgi:hypothetical protein